jgi:hypothetical protein
LGALIRQAAALILRDLVVEAKRHGVEYTQLQLAKTYLQVLGHARALVLVGFGLIACVALSATGWVVVLLGASRVLALQGADEGVFLLATGLATLLIPLIFFLWINQERRWIKKSGAFDLAGEALDAELARRRCLGFPTV